MAAGRDLFRTRDFVADFDSYVTRYADLSADTRRRLPNRLDVAFGDGPAERLDLFFPPDRAGPAPLHLFIHGGYWRMFDKADFSFVAGPVVAAGGIAAIVNYSLMPSVRMDAIVRQVRQAARWLADNAASLGGDPGRFTASGHSAGAQLCSLLMTDDAPVRPCGALLVSGIYELSPLQDSFLKTEIALTDDEVARFSPLRLPLTPPESVDIVVGETETAPFHEQAEALDEKFRLLGARSRFRALPGGNHMSAVLDLASAETEAGGLLHRMVRDTPA